MARTETTSTKGEALLEEIRPELMRLLEDAPLFGRWSISGTMRHGRLTSTDVGIETKRDVDAMHRS